MLSLFLSMHSSFVEWFQTITIEHPFVVNPWSWNYAVSSSQKAFSIHVQIKLFGGIFSLSFDSAVLAAVCHAFPGWKVPVLQTDRKAVSRSMIVWASAWVREWVSGGAWVSEWVACLLFLRSLVSCLGSNFSRSVFLLKVCSKDELQFEASPTFKQSHAPQTGGIFGMYPLI